MDRVRRGELPWTNIDALHRMILDELLDDLGIGGLTEGERDHLNRAWHRLSPWPDAVAGLTRLRSRFTIAPLSNGNVALLTNMAKNAGLPWDCILSAELARHYKPDPEVYSTAAELLGLPPTRVMMVAAHGFDLKAAQAVGMRARTCTVRWSSAPAVRRRTWTESRSMSSPTTSRTLPTSSAAESIYTHEKHSRRR